MRKVSMATRAELIEAIGEQYRLADRGIKGRVLDEFLAVTRIHKARGPFHGNDYYNRAGPGQKCFPGSWQKLDF